METAALAEVNTKTIPPPADKSPFVEVSRGSVDLRTAPERVAGMPRIKTKVSQTSFSIHKPLGIS